MAGISSLTSPKEALKGHLFDPIGSVPANDFQMAFDDWQTCYNRGVEAQGSYFENCLVFVLIWAINYFLYNQTYYLPIDCIKCPTVPISNTNLYWHLVAKSYIGIIFLYHSRGRYFCKNAYVVNEIIKKKITIHAKIKIKSFVIIPLQKPMYLQIIWSILSLIYGQHLTAMGHRTKIQIEHGFSSLSKVVVLFGMWNLILEI